MRFFNDSTKTDYGVDDMHDGTKAGGEGLVNRDWCRQMCCEDTQCVGVDYHIGSTDPLEARCQLSYATCTARLHSL